MLIFGHRHSAAPKFLRSPVRLGCRVLARASAAAPTQPAAQDRSRPRPARSSPSPNQRRRNTHARGARSGGAARSNNSSRDRLAAARRPRRDHGVVGRAVCPKVQDRRGGRGAGQQLDGHGREHGVDPDRAEGGRRRVRAGVRAALRSRAAREPAGVRRGRRGRAGRKSDVRALVPTPRYFFVGASSRGGAERPRRSRGRAAAACDSRALEVATSF